MPVALRAALLLPDGSGVHDALLPEELPPPLARCRQRWRGCAAGIAVPAAAAVPSCGSRSRSSRTSFLSLTKRWYLDGKKFCPNCWANAAYAASLRAKEAVRRANEDARAIDKYDHDAQEAWADARDALETFRQADLSRRQRGLRNPKLRPFWRFCGDLAEQLRADPSRGNEPGTSELREYCENLQDSFEGQKAAPEAGFRMYDQNLQEEPRYPVDGGSPVEPKLYKKGDPKMPKVPKFMYKPPEFL
eukprot:TRINITY_DN27553_c0_g1_i1.p1 TRINITY_DN27553_c0_g1~~TRINITY_DN27553_c0_g1_i1.p1  ORF type:complete len:247 (-),score=55.30 TRINITY_DN27553_c0_g1_i1:103-843(-)